MARGIDLGDVTFGLGADTAGLDRALTKLRSFGQEVNRAAKSTEEGAAAMTAALARQERLVATSFQKVTDLNRAIRATGAPSQQIANLTTTFKSLTNNMTQGVVGSLEYGRAQTQVAARLAESRRALSDWAKENERVRNLEKAWVMAQAEDARRTQQAGRTQASAIGFDERRTQTLGRAQSQAISINEMRERRMAVLQMQAQAEDALRSQGKWHEMLHNLGRAVVLIEGPLSGLGARMTVLSALFESSAFKMAMFVAGSAALGAGIAYAATAGVKATIQWQQWQASMVAASGSQLLVTEDMKYIIGVSREFGQSIEATIPAWTSFATAARLSGMTLKEQKAVFEGFMTAGSALHWNTDKISRAFLALEQIMSKGAPQMQEVRLQLGQVLPGAFQLAADGMKMTTSELSKAMEQGKIKAKEFVLAISEAVALEYRAASQSGRTSITSDIQRFHIETFMLARAFDEATRASGLFHAALRGANSTIQFAADHMRQMVLGAIAVTGAVAAWFLPTVIAGIATLTRSIYAAATAMTVFGAASMTNPFIAVTSLLIRLAAALGVGAVIYDNLNRKQDEARESARLYGEELKKVAQQAADKGSIDKEVMARMTDTHREQMQNLDAQIKKQEETKAAYERRAAAQKQADLEVAEASKRIPRQYRGLPGFKAEATTIVPPGPSRQEYLDALERHKEYLRQRQEIEDQWNKLKKVPVKENTEEREKDEKAVRDFIDGLTIQTEHLNDSGSKYLHILAQAEKFALKNESKLGGYGSDKMVAFLNQVEQLARKAKVAEDELHAARRNNESFDERIKQVDDARTALEALGRTQREQNEQVRFETSLIGLNANQRELATAAWQRQKGAVEAYRAAAAITHEDDRKAALENWERQRRQDKEYLESLENRQKAEQSWLAGAQSALTKYIEEVGNAAKQSEMLFTRALQGMENTLVDMLMGVEVSLKNLSRAIAQDVVRAQVRTNITGPISAAISGSGLLDTIKGFFGFASGGDHIGGYRIVGERGPELEATGPSRIFTADQTREILGGGGNGGSGSGGGSVRIEIINKGTPQQVTSSQASFDIKGAFVRIFLSDLRDNGPMRQGMQGTFGLR